MAVCATDWGYKKYGHAFMKRWKGHIKPPNILLVK